MTRFSPTRSPRGPGLRKGRTTLNAFAQALADGAPTLAEAGQKVGISHQRASQLFAQIRAELGWQAR